MTKYLEKTPLRIRYQLTPLRWHEVLTDSCSKSQLKSNLKSVLPSYSVHEKCKLLLINKPSSNSTCTTAEPPSRNNLGKRRSVPLILVCLQVTDARITNWPYQCIPFFFFPFFSCLTFHLNNITFHCFIVSVYYQLQHSILLLP